MSEKYHIARGEEKFGPYTKPQIEEYLAAGTLIQTDLAWTEGQDDWVPLSQLKNSGPPPPPSPDAPPMMGAPTGGHPMPGAMDTPPMMGAPVGTPPAAADGSSTKTIVTWVIRGVLIFILIGLTTIYFVKDRPAKAEMMKTYDEVQEHLGTIVSWDDLKKDMKDRDPEKSEEDGRKIATYTWKGFLLNYQIILEYSEAGQEAGENIVVDRISSK